MNLASIFTSFGVFGLGGIIIIETGFLPLFFLPGDTLLFSAGYFIHRGDLSIQYAIIVLGIAAFLGNVLGYAMGLWAEKWIEDYVERHKERLSPGFLKTKRFFTKYGLLTILIARFVPLVRTITPFLAGVAQMKKSTFLMISLISGFIWVSVGIALGNFFGQTIPNMDFFVTGITIFAILFAIGPIAWPIVHKWVTKKKED